MHFPLFLDIQRNDFKSFFLEDKAPFLFIELISLLLVTCRRGHGAIASAAMVLT